MFKLKSRISSLTNFKVFLTFLFIGFLIYANSLSNEFMRDDNSQVVNNHFIQDIRNIPIFFSGSTFYGGDPSTLIGRYYKPIMPIYFTIINSLFGLHASVFHFFQILIHIVNSFLIFCLFKKFFKNSLSILLGLLFLVHPINTEAVVYVSSSQEVLFLFFGLIALLVVSTKKSFTNLDFGLMFITLLLSLLSKETGFLFVLSIVIYIYLYNRKYFFKFLSLSSLLIFFYLVLRINAIGLPTNLIPSTPIMKAPFLQRLINIPLIIYTYLITFLFPKNLAINQSWVINTLNFKDFYKPLLFNLLVFGLITTEGLYIKIRFKTKFREYIFFLSIFLMGLGLHLNLIPLDMTVAERWFYFPVIGLIALIGLFIRSFKTKNKYIQLLKVTVAIVIISMLGLRVIYRNLDWKNEAILVKHDIKISRESYHLEQNLANYFFLNDELEKAIYHYKRSIVIFPYFTNYTNLGTAFRKVREIDEAENAYKKALEIGNFYLTYEQIVILYYYDKKDYSEAVEYANKGLKHYPNNYKIWFVKALSHYKLDDLINSKQAAYDCYTRTKYQECYKLYYNITNNIPVQGI